MLLAATRLIRSISLPRVTTAQNLLRNSSVASFKSPRRAFSVLLSHGIRPRHLLSVPAGVLLSTAIVSNRTLCAAEESGAAAAAAAGMDELQRTVPDENADIARAFPFSYAIVGELGFGGVAGFCTGYAVKKLGKSVAVVAGVGFISIQALAYSGVITVDWKKVEEKVGPVTTERVQHLWSQLYNVLTYNVPFGAAFATGVFLGLKSG